MTRKRAKLSHVAPDGSPRMVDVSAKPETVRTARAQGTIRMSLVAFEAIRSHQVAKGDVLSVARLAGIMGAKRTPELIPLCHPLAIESVTIEFKFEDERTLRIEGAVQIEAKTGVEMEALTAASVAALTVYDMCKAVDRGMVVTDLRLLRKSGGKSGTWEAEP